MKSEKNIFIFFNLFSCFKILSVYKSKGKMENHTFLWNIFCWRWAQVLSHHFSTNGSRTSTQRRGSATGNTIEKHNGETKRETTEKNEKWKKIFLYFSIYLIAFKILSVYKSKEKMENHRFLWFFFWKMGTSPKSSFFQRLARGLRPNDGVVQRGIQ